MKLDQTFVQGIDTDPSDKAIVEAIIQLGRALDLGVIAEGIECGTTIDKLLELGCHRGQGYLMSVPMSPEELAPVLRAGADPARQVPSSWKGGSRSVGKVPVTTMADAGSGEIDSTGQLHEPWVFLTMLDQVSTNEVNIGFIYSVLDLLARRYRLTDAVVVLRDEALGTQAFRLGQKSLTADSPANMATAPGVFCEPDVVPYVVRDVVRNVCQLALTLHLARHSADHDPLTNIANRRHFDAALRNAAVQSARYGWAFTLVLIDLNGFKAVNDQPGTCGGRRHVALFRLGPAPFRAQWRHHGAHGRRRVRHHSGQCRGHRSAGVHRAPAGPPRLAARVGLLGRHRDVARRFDRPGRALPHCGRPPVREEGHRAPMTVLR